MNPASLKHSISHLSPLLANFSEMLLIIILKPNLLAFSQSVLNQQCVVLSAYLSNCNFTAHIRYLSSSPVKGIIRIILLSILYFLLFSCIFLPSPPPKNPVLVWYFKVCWKYLITSALLLLSKV